MRNRITPIIMTFAIAILIFSAFKGLKIGNFQIFSVNEIIAENEKLKNKIEEASKLTTIDYHDNMKMLNDTYDRYLVQKQKYEELSRVTNKNDKEIYETKQYDIDYLWKVLGKYVTEKKYEGDEGLTLEMDVQKNKIESSSYNLNFTVSGEYTRILQFILDLENDSELSYRIYNFKMVGNEKVIKGQKVIIITATFTVMNVNIDPTSIIKTETITENS